MYTRLNAAYDILEYGHVFWKALIHFSIEMYKCIGYANIYR